jgi:hypothetical protein
MVYQFKEPDVVEQGEDFPEAMRDNEMETGI